MVGLECVKKVGNPAFLFVVLDNREKSAILIQKLSNRVQIMQNQQKTTPMGRFIKLGSAQLAIIEQSFQMNLNDFRS